MTELTDAALEVLAAEMGLDLDAPDPFTAELIAKAGRDVYAARCCERWPHRLEAI
jgi:hypothetical protein